jgi:hypothetical protein
MALISIAVPVFTKKKICARSTRARRRDREPATRSRWCSSTTAAATASRRSSARSRLTTRTCAWCTCRATSVTTRQARRRCVSAAVMRSCSRTATCKIRPTWCENGRRVRESCFARRRSRSEYGGARASHQRLSQHVPWLSGGADALRRRRVQLDVGAGRQPRSRACRSATAICRVFAGGPATAARRCGRTASRDPRERPSRAASARSCRHWDAIPSFRYRPLRAARPSGWRFRGSGTWMA